MSYREDLAQFLQRHPYETRVSGGGTFSYILTGEPDSQPVVFLNGGMNCSSMWMHYVEELSDTHLVLAFDYPRELENNETLLAGIHQFFLDLGLEQPVLIGASYGGMVAQLYLRRYPEQVGGLVLLSTGALSSHTLRGLKRKYFMAPMMMQYLKHCNYEKIKPKLVKAGLQHGKAESEASRAYLQEMFEVTFETYTQEKDVHATGLLMDLIHQTPVTAEQFASMEGYILLILPDQDFFPEAVQKELIALMHAPRVRYVEGGHLSTVLHAKEYCDEIEDFLREIGE